MDTLDQLREQVETRIKNLEETIAVSREELLLAIEVAKTAEILNAIKALGTRLAAIEARLPAEEED